MLSSFKFHHIGVATFSIQKTAKYYIESGYLTTDIIFDSIQNVNICFLQKKDMPTVELLEPASEKSPVTGILKKNGVTPYHICYEVKDIEQSIIELRKMKYIPLSKPVLAIALENRKICFLYNKEVGLIELLQEY